jgi:hypothetical protein
MNDDGSETRASGLSPGDLVTLGARGGRAPVLCDKGEAVNDLYGDEVALVLCVGVPSLVRDNSDVLPVYPLLLPVTCPMGWCLGPHLLRRL